MFGRARPLCVRMFSAASTSNKQVLQRLRSETGLPFIKIKEALQETDNNPVKALQWLEEKAAEQNWAKAQKLSQRKTSHGLVGIVEESDYAGMVVFNCETESVAKNEMFASLLHRSVRALQQNQTNGMFNSEHLLSMSVDDEALREILTTTIGRLGENIHAKGGFLYKIDQPNISSSSYIHRRTASDISGLSLGSIGSLAIFENLKNESVGAAIAQHIVGTENCENLLDQPLLQDESVTISQLCKEHNFKILDFCRFSAH